MTAPRVVSLVPSITETLLSWQLRPVAVTRFCEAPGIPTVGGTKNPDVAAIVTLAPDLVLLDREENRREDADALEAAGVAVFATQVRSVTDVEPALAGLADAVGIAPPPAAEAAPSAESFVRAWIPIWRRPWMSIGHQTYGSSLLAAVGVDNVFAGSPDAYPEHTLDDARGRRPDVVLAPSEPYPFKERHRSELESVAPVVFVDGQDLFWWGARTPAAIMRFRELAATLPRR